MHYASKTASASRGIPAIRLTLRNPSGFSVPVQFLVLIQNPAGGGSRQFNRFLQDATRIRFCYAKSGSKGGILTLDTETTPTQKTVGFPKTCGNFSTKSHPTTPKVKVVRPEQIRLLLERSTRFAGGGSHRFNHFLAELTARADLFAAAGNCVAKKRCLLFRMPHGFDFATQNLGAREEFLHLIRKPPPLRKNVGFPNLCGNFSTKSRPTTPKVKVVRPEQIRLLLERSTRFAGGGSRQFNHFHAELATGQICSRLMETALQKKYCLLLGCHTDSILLRKIWEQGRNSYT